MPADPAWVRWSGGVLIGIAMAAWLAAQKPNKRMPLVVGLALTYLLVALSLLYSTISGESGERNGSFGYASLSMLVCSLQWCGYSLGNKASVFSCEPSPAEVPGTEKRARWFGHHVRNA